MSVENKNIGIHNQAVTATVQQERYDGNIETAGNVGRKYLAGSIAKLYLAAAAFAISREGNFDLEDRRHITLREFTEGNYGTGELRFTNLPLALGLRLLCAAQEHPVTFRPIPNRRLLELMVSKSDNLATLAVVNTLGREQIQQVLTFWGMKETTIYNTQIGSKNQTTADDMSRFLHDLSLGTVLLPEDADVIKSWMPTQQVKNAEPVKVRYKDGRMSEDGRSFYHIVGFVEGTLGENIFVILTEGAAAELGRIPFSQELKVSEIYERVVKKVP